MKTIGLLGGMSWESSAYYYRAVNEGVRHSLGGLHSAKIVMYSVDFEPIEQMQNRGDWAGAAQILADAAKRIELAGADCLLICTNTMHKVSDQIEGAIRIPLLHIVDPTAEILLNQNIKKLGLLGTRFTMEQDFYKGRLTEKFGLNVMTPNKADREIIHRVIYQELCLGQVIDSSKEEYLRIISKLAEDGAEGIILGCTEIGMLVSQRDTEAKLFDTTLIHANKAVQFAIGKLKLLSEFKERLKKTGLPPKRIVEG